MTVQFLFSSFLSKYENNNNLSSKQYILFKFENWLFFSLLHMKLIFCYMQISSIFFICIKYITHELLMNFQYICNIFPIYINGISPRCFQHISNSIIILFHLPNSPNPLKGNMYQIQLTKHMIVICFP